MKNAHSSGDGGDVERVANGVVERVYACWVDVENWVKKKNGKEMKWWGGNENENDDFA